MEYAILAGSPVKYLFKRGKKIHFLSNSKVRRRGVSPNRGAARLKSEDTRASDSNNRSYWAKVQLWQNNREGNNMRTRKSFSNVDHRRETIEFSPPLEKRMLVSRPHRTCVIGQKFSTFRLLKVTNTCRSWTLLGILVRWDVFGFLDKYLLLGDG